MKTSLLLVLAAVAALAVSAPAGSHSTKARWSEYETEKRLTIGRFAATHGVKYAECLGVSPTPAKAYTRLDARFVHLECTLQDKSFSSERQVVVHVRTATAFSVVWLTTKDCAPPPTP